MKNVLPPRTYRLAELILSRIYRANVVPHDRMARFTQVGVEILNALRPADGRALNPGRFTRKDSHDHDTQDS
jgi:hypothetical protein